MIVGIDATTLRGPLTGVGYYTARLIDSLANGAGEGVIEKLVVLSNREVSLAPTERLLVHAADRLGIRSLWMQLVLPGVLRRTQPDLVHYTNYLAPLSGDTPYVLSIHDMSLQLFPRYHTWKKRLLTSRLLPAAARRARAILVPSDSTRRDVTRLLDVDPARVRVIPYAAPPHFRRVAPDAARLAQRYGVRAPYFLYVGTLEPRKNLDRLLRAFAAIASAVPEHSLVLVGQRGWSYGEILREAARKELAGRVVLTGYVPEADLPELLSGAVAFVYPSHYEGFGLPVVEAMACGTPVLTSRCSSLAEIGQGAALLVDPGDERALREALLALATDPALRRDLAARGLERAAGYSWQRTGRETVAAYQEALAPRRPAATLAAAAGAGEAILRSVAYAGLFEAPLSTEELHRSLMDVALEREALERETRGLVRRGLLGLSDGLVHPPGREAWLPLRRQRREHTARLLARHRSALDALARLPYLRMVALSGGCAHQNASDDDVDLFLIVREGRAFSVFLWLVLLAKLLGLRRSLCFNYIVDEAGLALRERDLFTATEIVGMRPLWGRDAYLRFVAANAWAAERFPNFGAGHRGWSEGVPARAGGRRLERLLELGVAPLVEPLARWAVKRYLGWRLAGRPGVRLEPHRLKLHADDHGPRLLAAFERALAAGAATPLPDRKGA